MCLPTYHIGSVPTPAVRSTVLAAALAFLLRFSPGADLALALLLQLQLLLLEAAAAKPAFVPFFLLTAFPGGGAVALPPLPKKLRIEGCQGFKGKKQRLAKR